MNEILTPEGAIGNNQATAADSAGDAEAFINKIRSGHNRVDPCFMTGKACVYADSIEQKLKHGIDNSSNNEEPGRGEDQNKKKKRFGGFAILPFRENIEVFYQNCLEPFVEDYHEEYDIELDTAHRIRRIGLVICEGVCKRIQESHFVVADISVPNENVFYELGLAYGLRQKILIVYHKRTAFGEEMAQELTKLGLESYAYENLRKINAQNFRLSQKIRQREEISSGGSTIPAPILLYDQSMRTEDDGRRRAKDNWTDDIGLDFRDHMTSAIDLAVKDILESLNTGEEQEEPESAEVIKLCHLEKIANLENVKTIDQYSPLDVVRAEVEKCYCLVVKTGENCHPLSYFWLGYSHALGKNVIPITEIKKPNKLPKDLAFDIRAQRHMTFVRSSPKTVKEEFRSALRHMILSDFGAWSRKRFWNELVGAGGEISIFTGALHARDYHREMVGDWDLRAVSELTSYFGRHHYRVKIETPIYPPEREDKEGKPVVDDMDEYNRQLEKMMEDRNCILIASPDVNPLTEIALGKLYKYIVDGEIKLFDKQRESEKNRAAIVAFKQVRQDSKKEEQHLIPPVKRAFFHEVPRKGNGPFERGFESTRIKGGRVVDTFVSQTDKAGEFAVYAHLAILPNPFRSDGSHGRKHIFVLNGISGPATFALTHALTGGVSGEFVDYGDFNTEAQSENVLSWILEQFDKHGAAAVECFIKVKCGPKSDADEASLAHSDWTADWRRIRKWELDKEAIRVPLHFDPEVAAEGALA
jgi:hypothetical protein